MFLHSYWINSPFIPFYSFRSWLVLSSAGKLKVCLVVRGHWINHFKQEICWGFRISSVTYFSFLFSTAFPPLFVKEKSVEQDRESESARKWVVLWPSLQASEWLIFPRWDSCLGCWHLSSAGSGCCSRRKQQCGLCGKALDEKFPPNVKIDIHTLVP